MHREFIYYSDIITPRLNLLNSGRVVRGKSSYAWVIIGAGHEHGFITFNHASEDRQIESFAEMYRTAIKTVQLHDAQISLVPF